MTENWSTVFLTGRLDATDFVVINIGHAELKHHWGKKDISSPFARIYYVQKGQGIFHLPKGDIKARPGYLYLIPNYMPHSYECEPGLELYYMYVFQRVHRQNDIFDLYEFPNVVPSDKALGELLDVFSRRFPQLNLPRHDVNAFDIHPAYHDYVQRHVQLDLYKRMQLHGLVAIVFSFFMKHGRPRAEVTEPRIAQLVEYIRQHLAEPISIETLADQACLTKSYLIRSFRNTIGMTPLQYILQKKVQKAQTMLLGSDMSVTEVARAVGFQDTSYFIRMFRKSLGFTPQEYRRQLGS